MVEKKQKQPGKWFTALQFAALAGRPGDQHFIKNKVHSGKIIKCPRFAEKQSGGKPTGLWPEDYVQQWVAEYRKETNPRKAPMADHSATSRKFDIDLANAFISGKFDPAEKQLANLSRRITARNQA